MKLEDHILTEGQFAAHIGRTVALAFVGRGGAWVDAGMTTDTTPYFFVRGFTTTERGNDPVKKKLMYTFCHSREMKRELTEAFAHAKAHELIRELELTWRRGGL